jgi:lysophospholipase L1-like esterase
MAGPQSRRARILALGDSYTIGEAVDVADRWPARMAARLREKGVDVEDPVIIAQTGWTTDELKAGVDAAKLAGTFDLVTLLIGVNNQYRGRPVAEYGDQFDALLQRAISLAGGDPSRVMVVSIPDWGRTAFARQSGRDVAVIGAEIDAFNAVGRDKTARAAARFVDITPISRRTGSDVGNTAGDGLHPSGAMYGEWTEVILPVALDVLGGSGGR